MATETRCYFEKALVFGCAGCSQAKRLEIGERLVCYCRSLTAARRCERYVSLLRQNAGFVFRQTAAGSSLSNYQQIRLQCGGLQGLSATIYNEAVADNFDISALMRVVEDEHRGIERISLDKIIPRIAAFNPRPHRKKK